MKFSLSSFLFTLSSAFIVVNGDCTIKNIVNGNKVKSCDKLSSRCKDEIVAGQKKAAACIKYFLSDCSKNTEKKIVDFAMEAAQNKFATKEAPLDACGELCNGEGDTGHPIPADIDADTWNLIVSSYISGDTSHFNARAMHGNNINCWDTSRVESFRNAFRGQTMFNERLDCWNVNEAKDFTGMFKRTSAFNQDIGMWDVSSGTDFSWMFHRASAFNQDIGDWDVRSGMDFHEMFFRASAFNQDLSTWEDINDAAYVDVMMIGH